MAGSDKTNRSVPKPAKPPTLDMYTFLLFHSYFLGRPSLLLISVQRRHFQAPVKLRRLFMWHLKAARWFDNS